MLSGTMTAMSAPSAAHVRLPPLPPVDPAGGLARPRIAICGVAIESSTFSPHRSGDDAFTVRTGDALLARYEQLPGSGDGASAVPAPGFLAPGTPMREAAWWVPILHAGALPGGAVEPATYRSLREQIVAGLRAAIVQDGPLDAVYCDLHGAMSVVGMDDAEADLCAAIREAVGADTLISASFDLHGTISRALIGSLDMLTCYRMAPHEDAWVTRERAARHLLVALRGPYGRDPQARRPVLAWCPVPVLLPGEKTSTRVEPAASLYGRLPQIEARPGVLDASIWVGYAWADEPRCQAAVVVMGEDPAACRDAAAELARAWWQARDEFVFVGQTAQLAEALDACAEHADRGGPRPFVLSDSGDNPTAGGAGDVTWTLARLLASETIARSGLQVIAASVVDAGAVPRIARLGVGASVDEEVGARIDDRLEGPVRVRGVLTHVSEDPATGAQVVVRCPVGDHGTVHAILTERRTAFHRLADFTRLGLDPREADVLVVKIGYLEPELHELAQRWLLVLTPGGVDQDLLRLGHRRLAPGVHPFEQRAEEPDLRPLLLRGGTEWPAPHPV